MRFKIDPEVIRLIQMITAGLMGMTAVLTGTNALPGVALVWVVAVGSFLTGFTSAYTQGVQTNPPEGMLTEERAGELAAPAPAETEPAPAYGVYAAGRAPVE